ncbi:type I methionyl aminopeptidase [Paenibacillus flagellatus]|uniref:Methionine aminopeptidase n=1 Tax=Paenibacillus flagellatus TaxID=2211139 RepID=A0A2V5K7M8_9BACL|nr:type I methionyl aminopeptidase [Paenibacillus flagellatus]PYI54822.1 type I methionyl aminopeptidase [Paenibacillus flagellatus]
MTVENEQDWEGMRRIGRIVALARDTMIRSIVPGMTTAELDAIGEAVLREHGATPAPRKEYGFPGATCISINDVAAHGIPGRRKIRAGDMVNVDVSAELNGYYADTGATTVVDGPEEETALKRKLVESSRKALEAGIAEAKGGAKLNRIGKAIERNARADGFTVIRNLAGHGIGRRLHEGPADILNYEDKRDARLLKNGIALAIETFVSTGAEYIVEEEDGWTIRTPDRSLVAQFEHTVVATKNGPVVLTV